MKAKSSFPERPRMGISATFVLVCSAFGVLAFLSAFLGFAPFHDAVTTALDFWMAAGLLRLSSTSTWQAIAVAASIILVRKLTRLTVHDASTRYFRWPTKFNRT
jgi:ABC-type enterobactin transport system permease subunit